MADEPGTNGDGEFKTFIGAGFGTMMVRFSAGPKPTPPVASSRAYLRAGLPAVYQEGDFGMRFIGGLEGLLDPIVAILDALPAHFHPDHAPRDILNLLAARTPDMYQTQFKNGMDVLPGWSSRKMPR